jgi:type 1 glutamine amidotransferase
MRCFLLAVVCLIAIAAHGAAAEADSPLKICILSGCPEYKTEQSLPPFQQFLEQNYNVECTFLARTTPDDLPGLEALDNCDVALIYIKRMPLKGEQLERFKKYVTSGRPIVGVRTASHAVQTWLDFDKEVLGGNYQGHYDVGPVTQVKVVAGKEKHPILDGVQLPTAAESLYKNEGHVPDIQVLLNGEIPGPHAEALAWTREVNGGRVFYTSLGAKDTFELPAFRRMIANALFWTAKREPVSKNN